MIRKLVTLFFIPLLILLLSLFILNLFNRGRIRTGFEDLTVAEGTTIKNLLELTGRHMTENNEKELTAFLDSLFQNQSIIYIGLFRHDRLIHLLSRYEDYFPVLDSKKDIHTIDSPVGKILDIRSRFLSLDETPLRLHIGFSYDFIDRFQSAANRNFLLVLGFFTAISLFVVALVVTFEKKMFQSRLELEKSDQEKKRFRELSILTAEIAHEIKNPLNSIYLSFNALAPFLKSPDTEYYRDMIRQEIRRVNDIILSYTDLAKEIVPNPEEVEISTLMKNISWLMGQEFVNGSIHLKIDPVSEFTFTTDGGLLKQVLMNLLKNAFEANADRVEIGVQRQRDLLRITVTDNGHGIDPKIASDIFKPYISTKTKGMGLGLHIVSRIIEALSGRIELFSGTPGQTRFLIELKEMR